MLYVVRAALNLAALIGVLLWALKRLYGPDNDHPFHAMVSLVGQLDVLHTLFWALLPVLAALLLTPRQQRRAARVAATAVAGSAAAICGALVLCAPLWTRDSITWRSPAAAGFVALNVFSLVRLALRRPQERGQRLIGRLVLLVDLCAPAACWACRAPRGKVVGNIARLLPAAAVVLTAYLPWLLAPLPIDTMLRESDSLRQLLPGPFYQALVLPWSGELVLTDMGSRALLLVDPDAPEQHRRVQLDDSAAFQAVALDEGSRRLLCLDVDTNRSVVLDAATLEQLESRPIRPPQNALSQCRTSWFAERGLLYAYCATGLYAFCADGLTLSGRYPGLPGDLLLSSTGDTLLLAAWDQPLMALDPKTLEPLRHAAVPARVERLALDAQRGRLLLSAPMLSEVLVFDEQTLAPLPSISAFPGVRVIAPIPQQGLLLLAGLSPLLELRNLDHGDRLEGRLRAPPWIRWIAVDSQRRRAYLVSCSHGLWLLDLDRATPGPVRRRLQRLDPFYPLANVLVRKAQRLAGWQAHSFDQPPQFPESTADVSCDGPAWTESSSTDY
ncbi:MAG: hypothetical protein P9M14_07440 [Candidatus Alcyoniella australis]|nr:hypothetical protein [Candidatus Alcyoniella australis]